MLLTKLFRRLFHYPPAPRSKASAGNPSAASFAALERQAPLRQVVEADASAAPEIGATIICREAVLNRQQKVAGYQFMLQEAVHAHIRMQSRSIFHLYTEVLVQNLMHADIGELLGHRFAFIEVPDSFLEHPSLTQLPPANTFFILKPMQGHAGPAAKSLVEQIRALRARGYHIGVPDPMATPEYFHLMSDIDLVCVQGPGVDIEHGTKLVRHLLKLAPHAALLVRDLPGMEDFDFCFKLGATLFHGPFITSRERWEARNLGPNYSRLTLLLNRLRQDANTREIVNLIKQDAAIALRLLRYINSAANGLHEQVSSIERAIVLLGRMPLQRWLALMLCASNRKQPRADAVLEAALVRARTMELIAASHPLPEREAMFLTGLLSLIDVILQQPMEHALEALAIDSAIRDAILDNRGPCAAALALARACENRDISGIIFNAAACDITPEQASIWYMDALAWTLTLQKEEND